MEDANNKEDLQGSVLRQAFMRPSGALKPTSSGRSTPRSSPSYRRMRTPRRDLRSGSWKQGLFGRNRLFLWLILIIGWAYVVFYFQCKLWPDKHDAEFVTDQENAARTASDVRRLKEGANGSPVLLENNTVGNGSKVIGVTLIRKENHASHRENTTRRKKVKRPPAISSGRLENDTKSSTQPNATTSTHGINHGANFGVSWKNTSYGLLIGPFGKIEDSVLGWPAQKIRGACNRKTLFAHFVKSKRFVLIIHELSMTGAPLSMMELATELLGCGGTVSVIVLSRKGGLLAELDRRGIHVLDDRGELSIRTARKADLIVAGSAVCSSWIDQYLLDITPRSSQILWWIMENRREYFDRSKHVLGKVQTLMFLSESQSQQWLSWCAEEGIKLMKRPLIVPLSVNDELACIAGIECIFNNSLLNVEKMRESRNALRLAVRKEMGLSDNDMLVMSLSSINPGKGQRLFVESLATMYEGNHLSTDGVSSGIVQDAGDSELKDNLLLNSIDVAVQPKRRRRKRSRRARSSGNSGKLEANRNTQTSRNLLSKVQLAKGKMELKVLIGSVGSKSNKPLYLKGILKFLSQHPKLVKSLIWTPATTHVASLYAAADAYVINAQGVGETFGRVTIEAMAFGLPVLGTDAGGTKEIVEDKVTGLLHPVSRQGMHPLVQNLNFLLSNASARELLGTNGRLKVERMYLKHHMYEKLAHGIVECIKMK